jgi:hypothetical protein
MTLIKMILKDFYGVEDLALHIRRAQKYQKPDNLSGWVFLESNSML